MKRQRQAKILEIVSGNRIATQQDLAEELARRGFAVTQSSMSRDIAELGLAKLNGYYVAPESELAGSGTINGLDTAGDNLIVIKTEVGLAQPIALTIDREHIAEIVGTLAGDDTILVAVKNAAAQRVALKKIVKLFTASPRREIASRRTQGARPLAFRDR